MSRTSTQRNSLQRNDRILRFTRILAIVIIPFLVVAWAILYVLPDRSGDLFAWPIKPTMTAMMLGAAYLGGAYYFARVAVARQWHTIKVGFWPVTAFAFTLGIATILHWDRFTHEHISFVTWTALYFTTPFLVFGAWLSNRRYDPRDPESKDVLLSNWMRRAMGLVGLITVAISVLLFLQPDAMINVWPWKLTPLTARVVGAMFALPGLVGLGIAFDRRWSAARVILEAQAVSIFLIIIAAIRAWGEFDLSSVGTALFAGGMGALFVVIVALYFSMEAKRA